MAFMDDVLERAVDVVGRVVGTGAGPVGRRRSLRRRVRDGRSGPSRTLNSSAARAIDVEPVRSVLASCADLTRDIGATHLSSVRWILDV